MPKQQIKLISCGFDHCLAVTYNSGHIYTWGYGASGCLGHGTYESSLYPRQVTAGGLQQKKIVYAESGGYHSGAVSEDGYLYMWGRADVGQLGLPQAYLKSDSHGKVATVPMHVT
jgi:alpha-tubulin suppressor-like RCC1 family protein